MDILIKSFNRPYYLDRCLQSIAKYAQNQDYSIIVLDDGTPQKYLDKIQKKHSEIKILKSEFYTEKSESITSKTITENHNIPIDLWINAAKKASNYFVLIEDDFWFTKPFNLKNIRLHLESDKVQMLKLFWLGNSKLIESNTIEKNQLYAIYSPNLYTAKPFFFNLIFRFNRFKFRKIFQFLGIYSEARFLDYYKIYATSGAVFKRKYFLKLWKNHSKNIDEGLQLLNAVRYFHKKKNSIFFAYCNSEIMNTGFMSSATNQNKNFENCEIDMFVFNKVINEAWFSDQFNAMNNFPNDLNSNEIEAILLKENNSLAQAKEWKKWVQQFKDQYRSFGCKIN